MEIIAGFSMKRDHNTVYLKINPLLVID